MWQQKEMVAYFVHYVKLRTVTFLHVQFARMRGLRKSRAMPEEIFPFPFPTGLFG